MSSANGLVAITVGLKAQIAGLSEQDLDEYLEQDLGLALLGEDIATEIIAMAQAAYGVGADIDKFIKEKEQRDKHRSITDP